MSIHELLANIKFYHDYMSLVTKFINKQIDRQTNTDRLYDLFMNKYVNSKPLFGGGMR